MTDPRKGIDMWAEFKFGPINLWSVWPSSEMVSLDGEMKAVESDLWEEYLLEEWDEYDL